MYVLYCNVQREEQTILPDSNCVITFDLWMTVFAIVCFYYVLYFYDAKVWGRYSNYVLCDLSRPQPNTKAAFMQN